MAHEILGKRFAQQENRRPPWHELQGAVLRPGASVTEALRGIEGDFLVEALPITTTWGGQQLPIPGHVALVRPPLHDDPEPRVFGVVSDGYELLQHHEIARALDPLVERGWTVETIGLLRHGAQLFVTFHAGEYRVDQDEIRDYWIVSEWKGRGSVEIFNAPVRVVCANTYIMASRQARNLVALPHYRGIRDELAFAVEVLALAEKERAQTQAELERMTKVPLTRGEVREIIQQVYPDPRTPRRVRLLRAMLPDDPSAEVLDLLRDQKWEIVGLRQAFDQERERLQRLRDAVLERYDVFNEYHTAQAGTAWALWNAVTEVENHRHGKRRAVSVLWGARAETMQRCYALLRERLN
jgi:phage/plasmid-like protein (TIGR03299 family)